MKRKEKKIPRRELKSKERERQSERRKGREDDLLCPASSGVSLSSLSLLL